MRIFKIFILLSIISLSVVAKDILIVSDNYPPFQYFENKQAKGINVDIAKEVLLRMGYNPKFQFMPWQRALFYVKYGKADAIINASYKDSRAKYLYYPKEEIYSKNWYCFKLKNSDISINEDFSNINKLSIGVAAGVTYGGKIQKAIDEKKFKKIITIKDGKNLVKNLIKKKFDMFIDNKNTISQIIKGTDYENKIEVVKITNKNEEYILSKDILYLAFSKKNTNEEFVKQFSTTLEKMKKDGTIEVITNRYF